MLALRGFKQVKDKEFMKLLSSFRHVEHLSFSEFEFLFKKVPNFGTSLIGSIVKTFCIGSCFKASGWDTDKEGFKNLIAGLGSAEGFKQNLEEISMLRSGMKRKQVQKILNEYDL